MKLTATEVDPAKPGEKLRRLNDGQGLYPEITPAGVKWWYCCRKPDTGNAK
ncbi:Arm DNA-binding domain-containing protein [Thiolapillus sp.]